MSGKLNRGLVRLLSLGLVALGLTSAHAADDGSLVRMKAGDCKFTVLDAQGVTPLKDLDFALASPVDGATVLGGKTDISGTCALTVPAGRYVVRVRDMDLAILDASAEQTIVECRIVLPDEPLAVGGQNDAPTTEESNKKKGAFWTTGGFKSFVVGTAIVLAVGGGGYAIYEANDDDDDNDDSGTPPPPPPKPTRRSSRASPPSVSN